MPAKKGQRNFFLSLSLLNNSSFSEEQDALGQATRTKYVVRKVQP